MIVHILPIPYVSMDDANPTRLSLSCLVLSYLQGQESSTAEGEATAKPVQSGFIGSIQEWVKVGDSSRAAEVYDPGVSRVGRFCVYVTMPGCITLCQLMIECWWPCYVRD